MASVTVGSPFQVKSPLLKSTSPAAGNKFQIQSPLLKKPTAASPAAPAAAGAAAGGCANGNWSQAPPKKPSFAKDERNSIIVSILSLILSIPALIGAWCWPALLVAFIGGGLTAGARELGHYLSFGMTFFMMLGLSIYIYEHRRKMKIDNWWKKWGPFVLMVGASILVNADPLRHVLQDLEVWEAPGSSEYRQKCHIEKYRCLSPLGLFMTLGMTYAGFTLLMVAALWNANIVEKCGAIKEQWKTLRGKK